MKVRQGPTPDPADAREGGRRSHAVVRAVQAVVLGGVAVGTLVLTDSPEAVPVVVAPLALAFHQHPRGRPHRRGGRGRPGCASRPVHPQDEDTPTHPRSP